MEVEKRKREDDVDVEAKEKRGKSPENDSTVKRAAQPLPGDEEVEEFFAILKRIHVAVKYFQKRDGGVRCTDGEKQPWNPSFEREDFDGVKKDLECSGEINQSCLDLDLNSDPISDVSGSDD